jgi:hypothetical protein
MFLLQSVFSSSHSKPLKHEYSKKSEDENADELFHFLSPQLLFDSTTNSFSITLEFESQAYQTHRILHIHTIDELAK